MTFKKALLRGLLGIPIGVFISTTITVCISLVMGGFGANRYMAVAPLLVQDAGGELNAVVLQYLLSGVMGFGYGLASAVYQVDRWSITRQTVVHFVLTSGTLLPIAYVCHWVDHTVPAMAGYFLVFAVIYAVIWLSIVRRVKKEVRRMNEKLQSANPPQP